MAGKKITEFDTHSITAADYLLFSNAAGTITYKTTLLALLSNLTLVSETVGFTISGGTTPKTLTLDTDITASTLATISTAILVSNLDTDGTLAANSDTKVASQKATKTYVDTNTMALTGNQTVAGIKTFSSFPISPSSAPSADYEMANKKYVDDVAFAGVGAATESAPGAAELATQAETDGGTDDERIVTPKKLATTTQIPAGVSSALSGKVATSGDETINGVKTFGSIPVLPASNPTTDNQAVRKAYVDVAAVTTVKYGSASHDASVEETQNIAHGCGKTPKKIKLRAVWASSGGYKMCEVDTNGTGYMRARVYGNDVTSLENHYSGGSSSPSDGVIDFGGYANVLGVVSINSTNISIAWTKENNPTGTVNIYWEAIA